MCYELTLTTEERQAIYWVGYRYDHGDRLQMILLTFLPPDMSWSDDADITFDVSEVAAWEIGEIGRECDYSWACFDRDLSRKLTDFCFSIV